ncbi:unnamed protein product [Protopolystoma xenopodis]|uniref:Uncharacterized protein n=1 Tax=Protopolystoma xenopodis TaxID=117903 RepID=A0A3S5FFR0_9PLAT|nr:unnamed protein product [Protopolystoma xenopodis]
MILLPKSGTRTEPDTDGNCVLPLLPAKLDEKQDASSVSVDRDSGNGDSLDTGGCGCGPPVNSSLAGPTTAILLRNRSPSSLASSGYQVTTTGLPVDMCSAGFSHGLINQPTTLVHVSSFTTPFVGATPVGAVSSACFYPSVSQAHLSPKRPACSVGDFSPFGTTPTSGTGTGDVHDQADSSWPSSKPQLVLFDVTPTTSSPLHLPGQMRSPLGRPREQTVPPGQTVSNWRDSKCPDQELVSQNAPGSLSLASTFTTFA